MDVRFTTHDGLRLRGHTTGSAEDPTVLLLHGGGQTRYSWGAFPDALAGAGFHAVSLDLRGHGDSDWSESADYGLAAFAADIRTVAEQLGGAPVSIVGASLGGLSAMVAAGEEPGTPVSALVLVDVAPRMNRGGRDRIEEFMTERPEGFDSMAEVVESVTRYLPHRESRSSTELHRNLRVWMDGRYHWHWDPAFMANGSIQGDADQTERLERALGNIHAPVMLLRGSESEVVLPADAEAFARVVPEADVVTIAGAHHMVAGDSNDDFSSAALEFLTRVVTTPVSSPS
ncbi:alpha/beta fold hydrolase [Nocardioides hungaricus]